MPCKKIVNYATIKEKLDGTARKRMYKTMETKNTETPSEMHRLFESLPYIKKYSKDEIIYHQGDLADAFYYLKKGRVKVFMTSFDGMEKTLSTAGMGDLLGEGAFFDKKPRVSSAKATTAVELVLINEKTLLELIKKYPRLAFDLLEILAKRIRLLSSQLDSMTFMQADARIAQFMLEHESQGKVNFTHEEIATAVGVSRVTVSKTLSRFAKDGIISTRYRGIMINDREQLILLANPIV